MAVQAPEPKTLKSWEEAFQYPIPVVRRMEQQLRSDLIANGEKLRTLVGYFSLLFWSRLCYYDQVLIGLMV